MRNDLFAVKVLTVEAGSISKAVGVYTKQSCGWGCDPVLKQGLACRMLWIPVPAVPSPPNKEERYCLLFRQDPSTVGQVGGKLAM